MRLSKNEVKDGVVLNGFDYELQVWVIDGVVQRCGHPETMKNCCNGSKYAGQRIDQIQGHQ